MLPHFHMAVVLDPADEPSTAEDVDAIVSAEIPHIGTDPEAHDYVMRYMIHKPCDGSCPTNPNPRCRPGGRPCTARFPFQYRDETLMTRRGPKLRRRQTAGTYHRAYQCIVDNRWVVPYNAKDGLAPR